MKIKYYREMIAKLDAEMLKRKEQNAKFDEILSREELKSYDKRTQLLIDRLKDGID